MWGAVAFCLADTYMSQRGLVPDGLRALEQGTEGAHDLHLTGQGQGGVGIMRRCPGQRAGAQKLVRGGVDQRWWYR